MHHTDAAHRLFADYGERATGVRRTYVSDDSRSLRYFAVDHSLRFGHDVDEPSKRIHGWVRSLLQLEQFTYWEGRLPRENNRLARAEITKEERTLTGWSQYQRRSATRDGHCDYQIERLESITGFSWNPWEQRWMEMFTAYFDFVAQHGAPALRSRNPDEQRLAAWAARQRRAQAHRTLPTSRFAALDALCAWAWSKPPLHSR